MTFADAVVKETMRLWPIVPGSTRRVTKTFELGGYRIPKGWNVYLQTGGNSLLKDGRWMPDGSEFRPERFLQEGWDENAGFMPWGLGPHFCLGKVVAMTEAKVLLAVLARNYRVEVQNTSPETGGYGLPRPADGMPVTVERHGFLYDDLIASSYP